MRADYTIREAEESDIETLVGFTLREAREAEGEEVNPDASRRGVRGAFEDSPHAKYWVAHTADGHVVASTSVVKEWSNFRGGWYWWIQSVYIVPEHRGRGLVEALLKHLADASTVAGALELRLYAHRTNERALRAYRRCGFVEAPYVMMALPSTQRPKGKVASSGTARESA